MKLNWGYAIYLIFFIGMAGVATQFTSIFGDKSNTIFYWMAALGVTSAAFWAVIQQKWNERGQKKIQDMAAAATGGGGGAAVAAAAAAAQPQNAEGEIDLLVKDAETKLLASRISQGAKKISELPVIFVLGDKASTKTTVVMHSGMEPELLSGQVYQQDNLIAPTRTANFWFAKKAVFVETGGVWIDPGGWGRLLKKLSPPKMKSVFGGGGSAPRAAVLCIDLERFLQPGATEAMATVARGVQTRLNEVSQQFGISFPVYVLFTKSDRVTFFLDFVRNLSNEEATQVFGTTLPLRNSRGGVYAEEETQRLNQMFNELFYSLCDKRIEFLPRENDSEKLPGCYEFPREFRKLRAALVQFLVDVGRPSQLSTSPFLRGFYFTGVRPVVVNDVQATPIAQPRRSAYDPGGGGATTMFKIGDLQQQMHVPQAAQQQSSGRKVPQWVFLSHLFNDVILEDKAALGASEASTKTSGLQRVLLGLLAFLSFIWMIGMTVSFFKNRSLTNEVTEAAERLKRVQVAPGGLPQVDDLDRLRGLREKLALLTDWRKNGAPWSYRWGLYVGDDLYLPTRSAYYQGFQNVLFRDTQLARMVPAMMGNPAEDCGKAYATLRAYLITTSQWRRVAPAEEQARLTETLHSRWSEKREGGGEVLLKKAEAEFQFYSSDLPNGNPYPETENGQAVHQARTYQVQCTGIDAYYGRLISEANSATKPVNYNRMFPWTSQVVINNKDVPGAFTKAGWDWMRKRLQNPDTLGGEDWVLGPADRYPRAKNARSLVQELWAKYTDDIIARWRAYFTSTTVLPYPSNYNRTAEMLRVHSGSQAPVLYLIGLATQNTNLEPATDPYAKKVRDAMLWAHNVVPLPGTQIIAGKNEQYVNALGGLQAVVADFASASNDTTKAAAVNNKRTEASAVTTNVARAPMADLETKLDQTILDIMLKPTRVDISLAGPVNAGAARFCQQFNVIKNKFPFNPAAPQGQDTTLPELNALLQPGTGQFWQFYEQNLKQHLAKSGVEYMPIAGSGITFNDSFLRFFNQVARMSEALYRGGNDPRLTYSVQLTGIELVVGERRPATGGSIIIDGKPANLAGPPVSFTWTGSPSHKVTFNNESQTAFEDSTLWAVFRFFVDAQVTGQGGSYIMVYTQRSGNANRPFAHARFVVDLGGAPPVFDRNFMNGLRCIANAAR